MPNADDIRWFKRNFLVQLEAVVQGTPFTADMLTAIACQETGQVWSILRKQPLEVDQILALCVGDTLDGRGTTGRRAFPRTKSDLLAKANGDRMFELARDALIRMAEYVPGYRPTAAKPSKFCHGFGIFQHDIQFFLHEPDYFLERRYADFGQCSQRCVADLTMALRRIGWQHKTVLTDYEMACVAIAYNTGRFTANKGLKQGYFDGTSYYGEQVFAFLRLSKTVALDTQAPTIPPAESGRAQVAQPTPITSNGQLYRVDIVEGPLRLRTRPKAEADNTNVVARLPGGQIVRAITNRQVNGWLEIETNLLGAYFRGFAAAQYLTATNDVDSVPVPTPALSSPTSCIKAVYMPRREGTTTRRTEVAGPHSLNERHQPGRVGASAQDLRGELGAIIDWLAVETPTHRRYQPSGRTTFCNIYVHDYCHLAGVYLPRVWWTQAAIAALAVGQDVEPIYGRTIDEQRANDLFRWLRDFGLQFGWRQTGTATKLQLEVNQGAVGLIVARRVQDGLPGHIVVVVPETEQQRARRNAGDVVVPVQSQAGTDNFCYHTPTREWWKGERFADHAFWLHP